jgi:hypothetical protein
MHKNSSSTIYLIVLLLVTSMSLCLTYADPTTLVTTSTSPLFLFTVNGQVREDNVYKHYELCKHNGQVPFENIHGTKIVIKQKNMATEEFLHLSGAYDYETSNHFFTLEMALKTYPSEIYPTCETSDLQIFDATNSKKLTSLSQINEIDLHEEMFYILENNEELSKLDNVVSSLLGILRTKSTPVTVVVMAANSEVSLNVKQRIQNYETMIAEVIQNVTTNSTFVNTLYMDGAIAGGTLVSLFLIFFLGLAIFTTMQLKTSPHITDDYKMKDLKKNL